MKCGGFTKLCVSDKHLNDIGNESNNDQDIVHQYEVVLKDQKTDKT
jgi:hypothetical protein